MKNKKAVINQVFVYLMSTIAILFVGFLVTKFILAFTSDSKDIVYTKFVSGFEHDVKEVSSRYGSEEIIKYKLDSEVTNVCFVSALSCDTDDLIDIYELPIEESEMSILAETSNLLVFNEDGVLLEEKIYTSTGKWYGCLCVVPKNTKFTLLLENIKNVVWIRDYADYE